MRQDSEDTTLFQISHDKVSIREVDNTQFIVII